MSEEGGLPSDNASRIFYTDRFFVRERSPGCCLRFLVGCTVKAINVGGHNSCGIRIDRINAERIFRLGQAPMYFNEEPCTIWKSILDKPANQTYGNNCQQCSNYQLNSPVSQFGQ